MSLDGECYTTRSDRCILWMHSGGSRLPCCFRCLAEELNTDRCTMQIANMMQIIRLQRDIWKINRKGSVSLEESTMTIDSAEGRWVD